MRSDTEASKVTPNQELEVLMQVQGETAAEHGIHPKLPSGGIHTDSGDDVPTVWGWRPVNTEIYIEIGQATTDIEINPQSRLSLSHKFTHTMTKRPLPEVIQSPKFHQGQLVLHAKRCLSCGNPVRT